MAGEFVSWGAWARSQRGLSASARALLVELAALADSRGVVIAEVGFLAGVLGRSTRTVRRALAVLEERLLIVREKRREDGHQAASRVQLVFGACAGVELARAGVEARARGVGLASLSGVKPIGVDDNEGLRSAFRAAEREGWVGVASVRIALSAVEAGPSQFWLAVARRRAFDGVQGCDAVADVLTSAWLVARESAASIVGARRSWAAWTQAVTRACAAESLAAKSDRDALTALGDVPEGGSAVHGSVVVSEDVGIDELEGRLGRMVEALRAAGMSQTLAWAGSARIAQIALVEGVSQRHTRAGRDALLAALGVSPEAARAWMTLLVGSRRGKVSSLLEASEDEVTAGARAVVEEYHTHRLVV